MNKYSIIFIIIALLLGGVVVWQQQKINTLEEQVTLNTLNALKNPEKVTSNGVTGLPSEAEAKVGNEVIPTTDTPTPPVDNNDATKPETTTPETTTTPEATTPPPTTTLTTPNTIGSTLPVIDAKTKMDATVLASLGETEITGDVVAVDSTNDNIFYFAAHGKDADGRATSYIYKYNGDSKKMVAWYWERTTARFWIVGTEGTQMLWITVPSEPTTDPCWQKWLQPIEALDVKTPTAGTTTFTTPAAILEQANKDLKVCKLVNP